MSDAGHPHSYELLSSTVGFRGRVVAVRADVVRMPGGRARERDVVEHPGAVGVVALDADDRVVLVRQYRHPVGQPLWELPAGLLDVAGEPAHRTAARELVEEAGLRADTWHVLVDALTSPGMSDEAIRIYLARDLHTVPADARPVLEDEETELIVAWRPLAEAVAQVRRGEIRNGMAVIGLLAAARARADGDPGLRPVDAPWPDRPDVPP